jgi:hypothetical protein
VRLAAALTAGLLFAGFTPAAGGAEDEFVTGSGNASAQILRVGPTAARLSLAPTFGLSLADYLNTEGRGLATVADWAALGVARAELPDNTPQVRVVSTHKDADKGETQIVAGGTDDSGNGGGLMELYARATKAPLGESRFRLERFAIPGFIEINGGEAKTSSGIVSGPKGSLRVSTAVVTIDHLGIAGSVELNGLRWVAVQQTAPGVTKVSGSFSIGGAVVGGAPLDVPAGGGELKAVLDPINQALAPTGLAIIPPEVDKTGDIADVSPLSIQIVNSPLGRQFLGPLLGDIQSVREPITDAIIEASGGEASVAILVADLTLGIFSGASQLHIELGGATAFTEGQVFESPFGPGGFHPPDVRPQTLFTPGTPGRPAVPGTVPSDTGRLAAAMPGLGGERTIPGKRGGVAMAVGLVGLGVAIGLAAADLRRMRASRGVTA